jgi:Histidine kinase-like ATPase domain
MELASAVASVSESYRAEPGSIPRARMALTRFAAEAGATEEQQEQVRLVVSEAVTNAVQHAYDGRPGFSSPGQSPRPIASLTSRNRASLKATSR